MIKLNSKNEIIYGDIRDSYTGTSNSEILKSLSRSRVFNEDLFSIIQDLFKTINENLLTEELIQQVFDKLSRLIQLKSYLVYLYHSSESYLNLQKDFAQDLRDFLINSGLIKLALEEKRSIITSNLQLNPNEFDDILIIVPVIVSEKSYMIFCMQFDKKRYEEFKKLISLSELIFNVLGNIIFSRFLEVENSKLKVQLEKSYELMNKELAYSTVGKICLSSFHSLKNKTQVIASSFNLLSKLTAEYPDARLEKIFSILNKEVPEFMKAVKYVSEISKTIVSERKPFYFELDKFIYELIDALELFDISKNLRVTADKISRSKIFGNYETLLQALLLIFLEFSSSGAEEAEIKSFEDALKIILNLTLKFEKSNKNLINLFDEKLNVKFELIKNLLKSSSCAITTKCSNELVEIMITMPKRSSQFKLKEQKNA